MTAAKALKEVEKLRQDVMWVASKMQNQPEVLAMAFQVDGDTLKEYKKLVGDLFSLTEVVFD